MDVFLPSKEHDPHRLCVACPGKSCTSYDLCEECHDWAIEHCNEVAEYVEKLSLQCKRKKERKTKSSSSFYDFSPSIPVLLGQLPSPAGSRVVTVCALSSSVCAVTYLEVGLAITAAPFVPLLTVTPVEPSCKQHRVEDPKERERMMLEFEDCWVSGKSTPRPGSSSAPQP